MEVLVAVVGFVLFRDFTQQDLVVFYLCLVNFDCRLGSLHQENTDFLRIDIFFYD